MVASNDEILPPQPLLSQSLRQNRTPTINMESVIGLLGCEQSTSVKTFARYRQQRVNRGMPFTLFRVLSCYRLEFEFHDKKSQMKIARRPAALENHPESSD